MTRRSWRGAAATATLVAVAAVSVGPAGQASAADGRCAPGEGVTVIVDYGPLGGDVVMGCDPDGAGKPASQVVQAAGFSLEYVPSQPGFVCRVNSQPGPDQESCGDTPPADAYWGLFWSDADPASWVYSSEGVGSLDVPDGGSIGWRFQDGGARENPSVPPTPAEKSPSPQPSPSPSPQPSKPPKAADPTPTPTPSASVPPGTEGSSPAPDADPEEPGEQRPARTGSGSGSSGGSSGGSEGGNPSGAGTERDKPAEGEGDGGKGRDGDKGDTSDKGKGSKGKGKEDADREKLRSPEPSDSPELAALEPTSDEPLADEGSSGMLTFVAGGAVLLLLGAAGVIAWRRRV